MLIKTLAQKFTRLTLPSGYPKLARMSSTTQYKFETLKVTTPGEFIHHVELNRPEKLNAMNSTFWREMVECFTALDKDSNCRVVVVSGAGKLFTSGLDFFDLTELTNIQQMEADCARKAKSLKDLVTRYQNSFTSIEKCTKPVIAAVHNACIGGGIDMISACDIRLCTSDAWFQIKEVDIGLAADVGTLQRLPKVIGNDSLMRELTYTARKWYADEALQMGMVSRILPAKEELMAYAFDMAKMIALKSPVAVQGSKVNLNYSRDHTVDESLHYMSNWNMLMLQSDDLMTAAMAAATRAKEPPAFAKY